MDTDFEKYRSALSLDFDEIYAVDLRTMTPQLVFGPPRQFGLILSSSASLDDAIHEYVERYVFPSDKEKFLRSFCIQRFPDIFHETSTFTLHFRVMKEDGIHFIKGKAARMDSDPFMAVVGFASEDSAVLSRSLSHLSTFGAQFGKVLVFDSHEEEVSSFLKGSFETEELSLSHDFFRSVEKRHNEYSCFVFFEKSYNESLYRFVRHKSQCPLVVRIPIIVYLDEYTEEEVASLSRYGAIVLKSSAQSKEETLRFIRNVVFIQQEDDQKAALERDELTGILTRQAFVSEAETYLASHPNEDLDLIMADVSDLKMINNVYGLASGDAVIQYLAKCCYLTPGAIFVGRYEGDRVCLVARSNDSISLESIEANKERLSKYAPLRNIAFHFGIVKHLPHGISLSEAIDRGRLALASLRGKKSIVAGIYSPAMQDDLFRELRFQADFNSGIENGEFVLYYQPKYSVKTGELFGAEALVRWQKNGEIVSPTEFIKVFERDERIIAMDEYVFTKACQFQSKNIALGRKLFPISVNLSRNTLFQHPVAERYSAIAEKYGVPLRLVPLEITETAAISSKDVKDFADALYQKGFVLDMDDFGSGYSSLYSMDILHFDVIKIDKSLIDLIGNPRAEITLSHVIDLAQELGMTVIAEGVETREQFLFLRSAGCDVIQGFYFSLPLPESDFEALMEAYTPQSNSLFDVQFHQITRGDVAKIMVDVDYSNAAVAELIGPFGFFHRKKDGLYFVGANRSLLRLLDLSLQEGDEAVNDISALGVVEEETNRFSSLFEGDGAKSNIRFVSNKRPLMVKVESHYLKNEGQARVYFATFEDVTSVSERADFLSNIPGGVLYFSSAKRGAMIYSNEWIWKNLGYQSEEEFLFVHEDFLSLCPRQGEEILRRVRNTSVPEGKTFDFDVFDIELLDKQNRFQTFDVSGRLIDSDAVGRCVLFFLEKK